MFWVKQQKLKLDFRHRKRHLLATIIGLKNCNAKLKHPEQTYMDIMYQIFLLIDFVGFNAVLLCQSEDAVLSRSNVRSSQINPFCLLILKLEKKCDKICPPPKKNFFNIKVKTDFYKPLFKTCSSCLYKYEWSQQENFKMSLPESSQCVFKCQ